MIKKSSILVGVLVALGLGSTAWAQNYLLEPAFLVESAKKTIQLPEAAMPLFLDWNNDGKKDLLASFYKSPDGYLYIYLNVGTNAAPVFDGRSNPDGVDKFDGF